MAIKQVLVAGASGLVGYAAMKHFAQRGDCDVIAVSRRRPASTFGAKFVGVDLCDRVACAERFGAMTGVTHVVFAALHEMPSLVTGWREAEQIETNDAMLRNLLAPLLKAAPGLRHVTLLQGTKAYGVHVRPLKVPAREDRDEMREVPNFYWNQEVYLKARAADHGFAWTIFRPQLIFGESIGSAMNLIPAIGAYAAILKDRGEPLHYPGARGANVLEAVDADLIARGIDWAGETEAARDQAFNITNGDVMVWENVWPAIAAALGMEAGEARPLSMGEEMPQHAEDWERIRATHRLAAPPLMEFVGRSFQYADFAMGYGFDGTLPPALVSTVKIRQAGFGEAMDTEAMFAKWFRQFQATGLLPRP
jgi:nucleoside-diphosphate-sugar epimerase